VTAWLKEKFKDDETTNNTVIEYCGILVFILSLMLPVVIILGWTPTHRIVLSLCLITSLAFPVAIILQWLPARGDPQRSMREGRFWVKEDDGR
jgi:predicted membrane channel-forming protein YqfA (hemolysin III family)